MSVAIEAILIFVVLSLINVIFATINKITTIKGGVMTAALISGGYFGFYNIVMIYTVSDSIPIIYKVLITSLCNYVGVYFVKKMELKLKKDTLWKIECAVRREFTEKIKTTLSEADLPFNVIETSNSRWDMVNVYCENRKDSSFVKNLTKEYEMKVHVTESKIL